MDLVTGVVGSLIPKLLQLLQDDYKLQMGVREQVESLSVELETIHVFLHNVAEVPWDQLDNQVKVWAREVREASYDMEDVLDTFFVHVEGQEPADASRLKRAMKNMGNLFNKGKARRNIAAAIGNIKKQIQEVSDRHSKYKIDDIIAKPAATTSIDPRLSALYAKASQLVGVDEPRDALIEMLSVGEDGTSSKEMKTVSIVGFGGLGKTTLAKAVYDKVNSRFDCGAFVPVGRNPDPRKVLKDILIDLIDNETTNIVADHNKKMYTGLDLMELDERQLINNLRKFLEGKRYFIVLDDIWDVSIWGIIANVLVDTNRGSRVIATSRNRQVSTEFGEVYRMQELSDENGRKLLYTRTFGGEDKLPDNDDVAEVSRKILRKCQGVPLAIITIASLLASKQVEEWSTVYSSIGFGHGDNTQVNNMKKILSFSYYDLPCYLRTCMLYLSVYPEDVYIEKHMLIWRWIAEGLVDMEEGKCPFETGENYFHELINRGMILPSETMGALTGGRVHDMVLQLIHDFSREENFISVFTRDQRPLSLVQGNVRRLGLQYFLENSSPIQGNDMGMRHVRSINVMVCHTNMIPPVSGFQFLRVLALENCVTNKEGYHLELIGKLLHLRYLGLTDTTICELPKEIGRLKFLQTLMLDGTGIEELPKSLRHLTKLMCLCADEKTKVPDWIGNLTSLVELRMYPGDGGKCFLKELSRLRDLRVLVTRINLQGEREMREFLESLSNLKKIEFVDVTPLKVFHLMDAVMQQNLVFHSNIRVLSLRAFKFSRLPGSINPQALPRLHYLFLSLFELEQQDMEILGRFQELRGLHLQTGSINKSICVDGFKNLKWLNIGEIFLSLRFSQGAMARLEGIVLDMLVSWVREENLGLEFGLLGNLSSLQRVTATFGCGLCIPRDVEEVEAALRHAVHVHPNRPNLEVNRIGEDKMVTPESRMFRLQILKAGKLVEPLGVQRDLFLTLHHEATELMKLWDDLSEEAKHQMRRYSEEFCATEQLLCAEQLSEPSDLHRVMENVASMERTLKIYNVQIPRLAAILEELKAALSLQAVPDDDGIHRIANNVTMEQRAAKVSATSVLHGGKEEPIHLLDQD